MTEVKALVAKRGVLKATLTRLENWSKNPGDEADLYAVEARMRVLDRSIDSYEIVQSQIEELDSKDNDRAETELRILNIDSDLRRLRHTMSSAQTQDALNQSFVQLGQNISMAVERHEDLIKPKPFDGEDYLQWPIFFNEFETLIHGHKKLGVVAKFQILRECLKGNAYDAIANLPINEESYEEARALLKRRFDKKRLLFSSLVQKLFAIPRAEKENDLRTVYDKVSSLTKALEAIPASKEQIGFGVLIQLVLGKVDRFTMTKWEESGADPAKIPSWTEFMEFLDTRCNSLESLAFSLKNQKLLQHQLPRTSQKVPLARHIWWALNQELVAARVVRASVMS